MKVQGLTATDLYALILGRYDAGFAEGEGCHWLDLQDGQNNDGEPFAGRFWLLNAQDRTLREHQLYDSFEEALRPLVEFAAADAGEITIEYSGIGLFPVLTVSWMHHEDYRNYMVIYPAHPIYQG